jgi:hypothetical protein
MYWAVIRCNLLDPGDTNAFNDWYNCEHVPHYVSQKGFRRAWRLQRIERPEQRGKPSQKFLAIYETVSIDAFNQVLGAAAAAKGHPWEGWELRVDGWQRNYYRVLHAHTDRLREETGSVGRFWTMVRIDFRETGPGQEEEFNRWYSEIHVPDVCAHAGLARAWRLVVAPDDNDLGSRGQKYMAVYETDRADYLPRVRKNAIPWDGIWTKHILNWEIMFYRVLYQDLSGPVW